MSINLKKIFLSFIQISKNSFITYESHNRHQIPVTRVLSDTMTQCLTKISKSVPIK